MGALEEILPDEIRQNAILSGSEYVLALRDAQRAIEIASERLIAILGVESFRILAAGLAVMDYTGYNFELRGDWAEFVRLNNTEALTFLRDHQLPDGHGYILTATSEEEFHALAEVP
ncbi:MAG TPA: hypothetical protein VKX49_08970 [Bryobacteraceae bacterium]|jgi:hypothetical protein|nr:hypothetical protein [Bryobacteraceae bacterium]